MYVSATTTRSSAGTTARLYGRRVVWSADGSAADRDRTETAAFVHLRYPARAHVVRALSLKRGQHMAVGQPCEAMQEAQVTGAIEPLDHLRHPWIREVEEQVTVGGEPVREEHPACAELVLGVVRPEALLADRRRGDDGAVTIALPIEIDDREEIAVRAVLVADPREQIARRHVERLLRGGERAGQASSRDHG